MNQKTSRRRFLQASLVAATAPMFIPRSAFGANDKVNIAAIGTGSRCNQNVWHNLARRRDDVRVIAACDCFQDRREGFAKKCNNHYGSEVCKPYVDYKEVLALDAVDGIVVSTPDHWHVPIAYHAALAKKDMYVEKPLGIAMAWATKLRQAIEKNKVIFQYGTQQRSMKSSQTAMDLIYNGYIGKIKRVDVWAPQGPAKWGVQKEAPIPEGFDYDRWLGPAPEKPFCKDRVRKQGAWYIYDYALGFIAGWGAHPLDLLQWGMQADHTCPVKYAGTGRIASGGLADTAYEWDIHMEYEDGTPVRFLNSKQAKPIIEAVEPRVVKGDGTMFHGEEGWVSVSRNACYLNMKGELVNVSKFEFKPSDKRVYNGNSHLGNFVDCIRSRKQTINPFESAIRSDTISHLSDIVIRTGAEIHWDPKKETITNNARGKAMLDRRQRKPWVM